MEIQSNLQVADPCAGLRCAWERPSCSSRLSATSVNPDCLLLVLNLGLLSKTYGGMARPHAACLDLYSLERFQESLNLYRKKSHWKRSLWACKLSGARPQGITMAWQRVLSKLRGTQIWCLPAWLRRDQQRNNNLSQHLHLGGS